MMVQAAVEALQVDPVHTIVAGWLCVGAALGGYVWRQKTKAPATKMGTAVMFGLLILGLYLLGGYKVLDPVVGPILDAVTR